MRIRRLNEGLLEDEYNNIMSNTPVFYPIFKLVKDFIEYYTEEYHIIKKGTEVYSDNINEVEILTLNEINIFTEIPNEYLEFVEYRNKIDVDKELEMYKQSNKYNL